MPLEITNKTVKEANYDIEPLKKLKYGPDVVWPHAYEEGDEVIYFSADEPTSVGCYVASPADTVMEYTHDGATWTRITTNHGTIPFGGDLGTVYVRCKYELKDDTWNKNHGCMYFYGSRGIDITVGGNLAGVMPPERSHYHQFFKDMTDLVDASDLTLPTDVNGWSTSYYMAFYGCTNLLYPPKSDYLYVGNIAESHAYMFYNCKNLVEPMSCEIILSGSAQKKACYFMYYGCESIKKCQAIRGSSTGEYAFSRMYGLCYSLVDAGKWDVSSIGDYAFDSTFMGCKSLKACISNMSSIVSYGKYTYYNMYNGCIALTEARTAFSGGECACLGMFSGCTNLKTAYINGTFYGTNALKDTFANDYGITELHLSSLRYYSGEVSDWQQVTGGMLIPKRTGDPVCAVYGWQYCEGVNIKKAIADEYRADRYDWK